MKNKYRARILSSILVICLSLTSLIGSTFAWFTDSVQTQKNRIVSGNLDVEMYYANASTKTSGQQWENVDKVSATKPNFFVDEKGHAMLWEPGVATYTNFKVVNEGSVALKYQFKTSTEQNSLNGHDLTEVIKIAVIDTAALKEAIDNEAVTGVKIEKGKDEAGHGYTDDGAEDVVIFDGRDEMLAVVETMGTAFMPISEWDYDSILTASTRVNNQNTYEEVENSHDEECFVVVAYWKPSDGEVDNLYNLNNGKTADDASAQLYIDIDICLNATQYTNEVDGFDKFYDVTTEPVLVYDADEFEAAIAHAKDGAKIYVMTAGLTLNAAFDDEKSVTVYGKKIETLTVNAPDGEIHVHNNVGTVEGNNVALESAYFYNEIGTLEAISGHYVIMPGAKVTTTSMNPATEGEDAKDLIVEIKGIAQNITTPTENPAAEAKLIIGESAKVTMINETAVKNFSIEYAPGAKVATQEKTLTPATYSNVEVPTGVSKLTLKGAEGVVVQQISIPAGTEKVTLVVEDMDLIPNEGSNPGSGADSLVLIDNGGATNASVTLKNCKVVVPEEPALNKMTALVRASNGSSTYDVTVEGCTFENFGRGFYLNAGSSRSLTVKNCNFKTSKAWTMQWNGTVDTVIVDGCTFDNVQGVLKGGINNLTFTNNKIIGNCNQDYDPNKKPFDTKPLVSCVVSGNMVGETAETLEPTDELPGLTNTFYTVTPATLAETTFEKEGTYSFKGDFTGDISINVPGSNGAPNKTIAFDGTDATFNGHLTFVIGGERNNYSNVATGNVLNARNGNFTIRSFTTPSSISVITYSCKALNILNNTVRAIDLEADNTAIVVDGNKIDCKLGTEIPRFDGNKSNYGFYLYAFGYDLTFTNNSITNAFGHSFAINGAQQLTNFPATDEDAPVNTIRAITGNTINVVDGSKDGDRVAFKIWDDATYASKNASTIRNDAVLAVMDSIRTGNNTVKLAKESNHWFSIYNSGDCN